MKSRLFLRSYLLVIPVMLLALVISLVEYTYPYGPGTSQIILWALIGIYLNISLNESKFSHN